MVRRFLHDTYPYLGALAANGVAYRLGGLEERAFSALTSSALLSGLLTLSGLVVSVLLALLGILVALDQREIVQEIRARRLYRNLVNLAFIPMTIFMILSGLSVVGLFGTKNDGYWFRFAIAHGLVFLTTAGLLSTFRFAKQLVWILTDEKDSEDDDDAVITPEIAAQRGAGVKPKTPGASTTLPASRPAVAR